MTLSELISILQKIEAMCVKVDEDPDNVPIRIYGEHGEIRKMEFDAVGITMIRKFPDN